MLRKRSFGSVEVTSVDLRSLLQAIGRGAEELRKRFSEVEEVLLFGSFARDDYTPDSDVDLLVVVRTTERPYPERADPYREVFSGIPLDVNLVVYTREEVERMAGKGGFLSTVLAEAVPVAEEEG